MSDLSVHAPIDDAWYKHGWVWTLIAIPFSAVVMGVLMIYLATTTNNSLVVDDYYKQGKAINQDVGRDSAASSLGLSATVVFGESAAQLQLTVTEAREAFIAPDQLLVRWVHIALSDYDGSALATRAADGQYRLHLPSAIRPGEYRLHVSPVSPVSDGTSAPGMVSGQPAIAAAGWRLVSQTTRLGEPTVVTIHARPASPDLSGVTATLATGGQ